MSWVPSFVVTIWVPSFVVIIALKIITTNFSLYVYECKNIGGRRWRPRVGSQQSVVIISRGRTRPHPEKPPQIDRKRGTGSSLGRPLSDTYPQPEPPVRPWLTKVLV
jgi:hypothetical protein